MIMILNITSIVLSLNATIFKVFQQLPLFLISWWLHLIRICNTCLSLSCFYNNLCNICWGCVERQCKNYLILIVDCWWKVSGMTYWLISCNHNSISICISDNVWLIPEIHNDSYDPKKLIRVPYIDLKSFTHSIHKENASTLQFINQYISIIFFKMRLMLSIIRPMDNV